MVAVAIPSDVYLTYSIFILTASERIASFSLNLRADLKASVASSSHTIMPTPDNNSILPALPVCSDTNSPLFRSVLQDKPYKVPDAFTQRMILSSIPQLALLDTANVKSDLQVTPETLRYLHSVGEKIAQEIVNVEVSFRALKARLILQKEEYLRQNNACKDMILRISNMKGSRRESLQIHLRQVQEEQSRLLVRMDKVLQALISKASPDLNEHETKWFEELQRMKAQVIGVGRHDQTSLKSRIQQVTVPP